MAWLAVSKLGVEAIYHYKPTREKSYWVDMNYYSSTLKNLDSDDGSISIPKGSIKSLLGKNLTWDNEPVELKQQSLF